MPRCGIIFSSEKIYVFISKHTFVFYFLSFPAPLRVVLVLGSRNAVRLPNLFGDPLVPPGLQYFAHHPLDLFQLAGVEPRRPSPIQFRHKRDLLSMVRTATNARQPHQPTDALQPRLIRPADPPIEVRPHLGRFINDAPKSATKHIDRCLLVPDKVVNLLTDTTVQCRKGSSSVDEPSPSTRSEMSMVLTSTVSATRPAKSAIVPRSPTVVS